MIKYSIFGFNLCLSAYRTKAPPYCTYFLKLRGPTALHKIAVQIFLLPATHLGWQCKRSCSSQFSSKRSNCSPCS